MAFLVLRRHGMAFLELKGTVPEPAAPHAHETCDLPAAAERAPQLEQPA